MPSPTIADSLNIVVVEDHLGFREQLCQWLGGIPGTRVVHVADTAASAVNWIESNPQAWGLAVIDVFLAQGHGFQVLQACKGRHASQKAVLLTSYTREPVRGQASQLGADAVFDKAFEMESFIGYVRSCGASRVKAPA